MIFLTFIPFALLVTLLVRAEIKQDIKQIKELKPICSTWLVVLILLSLGISNPQPLLFAGILTAMLFSLGGDVALMFQDKKKFFMIGLVLFLLGHISYGVTFTLITGFHIYDLFSAAVLVILFFGMFFLFKSGAGSMFKAIIVYMLIISFMMNRAVSTAFSDVFNSKQVVCIISGAILFYASDVMLAWNKFYKPFKYNRISLFFYYSGQALIISSLYL